MLTLSIELPHGVPPNSNLLVVPKGGGKNTILNSIFATCNTGNILKMSDRQFESLLFKLDSKSFENKVWVVEDLIVSFKGLSKKQRDQLTAFYTSMLSNMSYERMDVNGSARKIEGRIVCMFGFAAEDFSSERSSLWSSTFLERAIPLYANWSNEIIERIKQRAVGRHYMQTRDPLPRIVLPFRDTNSYVNIGMDESLRNEILSLAEKLATKTALSITRASNYIINFLKANAYLNGREIIAVNDINMYKYIEDLHFMYPSSGIKTMILEELQVPLTLELVMQKVNNRLRRIRREEISEYVMRKYLNELNAEGYVNYDVIERGKRVYWKK